MKTQILLYFSSIILLFASSQSSPNTNTLNVLSETDINISDEEKAINLAVKNAYAYISFKKGTIPKYEVLRSIFVDNASLYNFRGGDLSYSKIDDFIEQYKSSTSGGDLFAFDELELGGKTEYFGNIAHRISSYASYINDSKEIAERGVNSFQLLKVDGKWLISSIIWDIESPELNIPDKYLDSANR